MENVLARNLTIRHRGELTKACLYVFPPNFEDGEWVCRWSCEELKINKFPLRADDEMGAYYYALNFIDQFIRNMADQNWEIWHQETGDNGGFNFSLNRNNDL